MKNDSWSPNQYEKFKNERSQPFFDLLDLVRPEPNMKIIDLGCGTGELTQILHQRFRGKNTMGVDNSESMLDQAVKIKTKGLKFKIGDIEKFRSNEKLDLIFSNAAIQWCDHHPRILKNLKTQLSTRGQLAIQMPMNHDYPSHIIAAEIAREEPFKKALKGDIRPENMLKPEEYAVLMNKLGFKEQIVCLKVYGHILPSREGVVEWVKGTLLTYYQSRLEKKLYEDFLTQFKKRLFKALPDEKPFFYPFKRILIWGKV